MYKFYITIIAIRLLYEDRLKNYAHLYNYEIEKYKEHCMS